MVTTSAETLTPSFKDNVKSAFNSFFAPFLQCCSCTLEDATTDTAWQSPSLVSDQRYHGRPSVQHERAVERSSQRSRRSSSQGSRSSSSQRSRRRSSQRGNDDFTVVVQQPTTRTPSLLPPPPSSSTRGSTSQNINRSIRRSRGSSDVFPVEAPTIHNVFPSSYASSLDPTRQFPEHVLATHAPPNWSNYYCHAEVEFINISSSDTVYSTIERKFNEYYNTGTIRIQQIQRVENFCLWNMYQLKKEEMQKKYGYCEQVYLFHATRAVNVNSICSDNFNWRLYGRSKGFKFGKGVSFTPRSSYASHFSDQSYSGSNKMLVVRVLKCMMSRAGWPPPDIPPRGYDTTRNDKDTVIVKYEDHTFYPEYLITYAGRCP